MSINVSIKSGKAVDDSSQRLASMISNNARQRRESVLKKQRSAPSFLDALNKTTGMTITKEDVEMHANRIADENKKPCELVESVCFFRKLLSNDHYPPIDLVIQTNLVPRFISFLNEDSCPELQYEAAWVLTNIVSGTKEQTAIVVNCGALPLLINLMNSPDSSVREQATWALGNIAGDNVAYRDAIINANGVNIILNEVSKSGCTPLMQKNAVWLLSNLCRIRDGVPTDFEKVKFCFPYMKECLKSDDVDVVIDALWSFAFITDCSKSNTKAIISMEVLPTIIIHLGHENVKVVIPALRTVGNILSGDDDQTALCIKLNVLFYLEQLLMSTNYSLVKEATWCLSNITAGNEDQIQLILQHNIIPQLVEMISTGKSDLQKEACWTICNAICGGNIQQIIQLVTDKSSIPAICKLLRQDSESKLISIIIDSLDRCLIIGDFLKQQNQMEVNEVMEQILDCGCLDDLEKLTLSDDMYARVVTFVKKYFGFDEDGDADLQDF